MAGQMAAVFTFSEYLRQSFISDYHLPAERDVEGWEAQMLQGLSHPIPLISFEYHQNDGGMQNAYGCLNRLRSLPRVSVNITPREQSRLALDEWVDAGEFKTAFQKIFQGREEYLYGDLYIRML